MGFIDKIQGAAADYANQQAAGSSAELTAALPAGTPIARKDVIPISARFKHSTVEAYLAIVGLSPEDVYAVIPEQSNDVNVAFTFVYRDRPEYEEGRARWASTGA
ncbi:MAG: hypothetical protein IPK93_10510 [Solirubrobacterales bacterium]|nr:hypothetical protein [Solirubrobacterales bacterium]